MLYCKCQVHVYFIEVNCGIKWNSKTNIKLKLNLKLEMTRPHNYCFMNDFWVLHENDVTKAQLIFLLFKGNLNFVSCHKSVDKNVYVLRFQTILGRPNTSTISEWHLMRSYWCFAYKKFVPTYSAIWFYWFLVHNFLFRQHYCIFYKLALILFSISHILVFLCMVCYFFKLNFLS